MAIQYKWSNLRGEEVEVGRLYDDGFLFLKTDPGIWIESNPDSLSSVRSLELYFLWYEGERIGDSIGELSQLTHLSIRHGCNLKCLPNTLSRLHNLHHLELDDCQKLEDLPPNFGDLYNLTYLSLNPCYSLKLIESVAKLSNLTTLVLSEVEELSPSLGGLYNLKSLSLFLDFYSRLRCFPWSITKLSNLRFLYLPEQFRLETLPPHLNDSVIISVEDTHIRKTWKELKTHMTETLSYQFPIIPEQEEMVVELALQSSNPGYLHFTGYPTQCDLHSWIQILDLDLWEDGYDEYHTVPDSIGVLQQLTHLYITHVRLPRHLPPTFSRLTHLSLIGFTFECDTDSHFDSLRNLSTLTSLHLCPGYNNSLPEHMELPISLRHLTLSFFESIPDSFVASMATLHNLKSLILSGCGYFENIVPLNLNFTKLILRNCSIDSIHIGLKHLEIIHCNISCMDESCSNIEECLNNQFVNLETLSFTCYRIKSLSSVTSLHNLRELQLKDCFNLRELPPDLDKLVNLYTLDVSGTRIHSLPDSIINLRILRHLILPKYFILKSLPDDFENVRISVDNTDDRYYSEAGYYDSVYELSDDEDSINSNSTEDVTEIVAGSRQEAIIEQASPHRPLNHPPDEIQILEDPTSNNNPNAFISSPNHEIENLPISNEAGTSLVVVNEYYSDVNANTMQDHDPMDIDEELSNTVRDDY